MRKYQSPVPASNIPVSEAHAQNIMRSPDNQGYLSKYPSSKPRSYSTENQVLKPRTASQQLRAGQV